jgi:proteic killer suppression protein
VQLQVGVIRSFRHKGLAELYETDRSRLIAPDLLKRVRKRLSVLRAAATLDDLRVPGFDFHPLRGEPKRYSIHVNGPWCVTFEWEEGEAIRVDLEQYH